MRAHIQFYKSIFPFIAAFALVGIVAFGIFWGFFFFITIAFGFGFLGFHTFRRKEWYLYENLGISKYQLFKSAFFINLLIGFPVFAILFITIYFFFGNITIT